MSVTYRASTSMSYFRIGAPKGLANDIWYT